MATLDADDLRALTGFKTVRWIDTTDDAAAVIGAAVAQTLCRMAPGVHAMSGPITVPSGVTVRGCGVDVTRLEFASGNGTYDIVPGGDNVAIENLTIAETVDGFVFGGSGAGSWQNCVLRNLRIVSANLEPVDVEQTSACSIYIENVRVECVSEWCMTFSGAAHTVYARDITCLTWDPSPGDPRGVWLRSGSKMYGHGLRVLDVANQDDGDAVRVSDASELHLSGSDLGRGRVNVAGASAVVQFVGCQYDRTKLTGAGAANVEDIGVNVGTVGGQAATVTESIPVDTAAVWSAPDRSLTAGLVRVVSPDQHDDLMVYRGASYLTADGNAKRIQKQSGASWPTDLTGWTITLTATPTAATLAKTPTAPTLTATGTVVQATQTDQSVQVVSFDLAASDTSGLAIGAAAYAYEVFAAKGSSVAPLTSGALTVLPRLT